MDRRHFLATSVAGLLAAPAVHAYEVPEHLLPQGVRLRSKHTVGQIIVSPSTHFLYLITAPRRAIRYGVGVGKAGLNYKGSAVIGRKVVWPSWKPTPSMIERNPSYARWADGMKGGPNNPLGARALYLYRNGIDTAYRIHGTTEPKSIGRSVSNGCVRMINEHVVDLYARVPLGTSVTIL
ncbi:MAG: L,D-transpeptidase [Oceanicola sp.]|nr:L,D-transpeptidase [Oceanicola sp.]